MIAAQHQLFFFFSSFQHAGGFDVTQLSLILPVCFVVGPCCIRLLMSETAGGVAVMLLWLTAFCSAAVNSNSSTLLLPVQRL
jgi:hypothetical protein